MIVAKVLLIVTLALYVQSCGWYVEDWNFKYRNCDVDSDRNEVVVECEWPHTWLGS